MRRDELLNLCLRDVDHGRMVVRISNGKGDKSRDTWKAVTDAAIGVSPTIHVETDIATSASMSSNFNG